MIKKDQPRMVFFLCLTGHLRSGLFQSPCPEKSIRIRISTSEPSIQDHRFFTAAFLKNILPE